MQHLITASAVFAALCVASPVEPRAGRKAFTVPQVEAGVTVRSAPAISMLKMYKKYGIVGAQAPVAVKAAAAAAQSGTVTAIPESYDVAYLSPVTIGGQELNLNFDTGSADLWVFSTLMASSAQSGHAVYDTSNATLISGQAWDISYGDGSGAKGVVYADKVAVGSVTATSQAVEAATSVSSSFLSDTNSDGLLGLAFPNINTVRPNSQTTFFDSVKSSLAQPLFTVDLKKGEAGSYDFGFIDSSKYTGDITYVNVNSASGFWQFTADGYAIGSSGVVSSSMTTIADTGTTLMYLPQAVVNAYYASISGAAYASNQGGYVFPCSTTPPDFAVVIGGSAFTVPGSYMNYARITSTYCFGGLQSNSGIGFSILGDIFLKSQFVIFSTVQSTPRIGFAAQSSVVGVDEDFEDWYLECDGAAVTSSS